MATILLVFSMLHHFIVGFEYKFNYLEAQIFIFLETKKKLCIYIVSS